MPGGPPTGSRPRGFAITDLLGLEAELPAPAGPGPGSCCEGPAAAPCAGPGLGDSGLARGTLPLGFGLLCSFGAQPPAAARAPCLLLADVPFLPPEGPEPPAPHVLGRSPPTSIRQKRSESVSTSGNEASPCRSCPLPRRGAQGDTQHPAEPHLSSPDPGKSGPQSGPAREHPLPLALPTSLPLLWAWSPPPCRHPYNPVRICPGVLGVGGVFRARIREQRRLGGLGPPGLSALRTQYQPALEHSLN